MKTKKCESCDACKQVFRNIQYDFWKSKLFYCTVSEKITKKENGCEKWQPIKQHTCDLSARRFDEAESDLKYLLSVLNDE